MKEQSAGVRIVLASDRPDLVPQLGEIYWREWGDEPGREDVNWWISEALLAAANEELPISFLAVDSEDQVLGGFALAQTESDLPTGDTRSPWATGVIVKPEFRSQGIGHLLVGALDRWVTDTDISHVWVLTGGDRAVAFYESCGWSFVERATFVEDDDAVILLKQYR